MIEDNRQAFVADIARTHGQRLRQFLAGKLRKADQDIPDLMQEIYLRLLRVRDHEAIRSPLAYLYTVAFHVIYQHKLSLVEAPDAVDILDALADSQEYAQNDASSQIDARQRLARMDEVLRQLPVNVYAAFVLNRRYGYKQEEIAAELGVSRSMVKKYLAKAIAHFQIHFAQQEAES